MNVLIACEFSGRVRDAFAAKGHYAISCDLLPTESPGNHYQGCVFDLLGQGDQYDLMIAHPPCTYLCVSGNRAFRDHPERGKNRLDALLFVQRLMDCQISKICIENPVGVISTRIRKPDQYIQPYHYGHSDSKKTGLWLKGLPNLRPTDVVEPKWILDSKGRRYSQAHHRGGVGRSKARSETYRGIALAMADQWGNC